jgi:hypothetical protein
MEFWEILVTEDRMDGILGNTCNRRYDEWNFGKYL